MGRCSHVPRLQTYVHVYEDERLETSTGGGKQANLLKKKNPNYPFESLQLTSAVLINLNCLM